MSKTYKTDPPWVYPIRIDKHKGMHVKEIHDHSKGPCDLPEEIPKGFSAWLDTQCWYSLDYGYTNTCGCKMCTGYYERKEDRRKERHKGKAYSKRDYIKEYE